VKWPTGYYIPYVDFAKDKVESTFNEYNTPADAAIKKRFFTTDVTSLWKYNENNVKLLRVYTNVTS
jgi:hypothetical protein